MTRRPLRPPYQVEVRWQPGPRTAEYDAVWRWLMRVRSSMASPVGPTSCPEATVDAPLRTTVERRRADLGPALLPAP
jgi:hypothetical protein